MTGPGQGRPILQATLPYTPWDDPALSRMPGMRPVKGAWPVVDDAYAAQMAERARLMREYRAAIWAEVPGAEEALAELLATVLAGLPQAFCRDGDSVTCPDGRVVSVSGHPFEVINQMLQEDVMLLDRPSTATEHVLIAGLLCFPAYWTLAEKIGRPLTRIHEPVPGYDGDVALRVQRLFDRVPAGRAMWRANILPHTEAILHRPRPTARHGTTTARYIRSERQTVLRLPQTGAVMFAVHTYLVPINCLTPAQRRNCPIG
ncbi:Protein of unknown function [Jannaschia faecimaris]|uniref:DUF3445 domain-containing protein n=1 Tax=Jannaschia faecimaris TaxID=1244108 RepID=A0A1H3QKV1_9RHOB|nr:DUF3445 domain-containing protein [Jannaschia faecimaris]SDZ13721.1 Protein of unknown function [Jannaschia faecimaris]